VSSPAESAARAEPSDSQQRWRAVRSYLNQHRHQLTLAAAGLYPGHDRAEGTPLLTRPTWQPTLPIPLDQIKLTWDPEAPTPSVDGSEAESSGVLPMHAPGRRYASYADALAALDPPRLLEDRPAYRLLDTRLDTRKISLPHGPSGRLAFGRGSYFAVVNICEAAAHEFAAAWLDLPGTARQTPERLRGRLPFRALIGDPCSPHRRAILLGISTLTLRRDAATGQVTFPLHWRDPSKVASGGGLYQVVPVGLFQPSADTPGDERADFDLWRCMAREFEEELLGAPEHDGGRDHTAWPFYQALEQARRDGRLSVYCLGLGIDPLTLVADILMVTVFDSDVADQLFGGLVADNAEGRLVTGLGPRPSTSGIPFVQPSIDQFAGTQPMQPAGAALLRLAWRHREALLRR
jgi:hypothetical protein